MILDHVITAPDCILFDANTVAADGLMTQVAKLSAAIVHIE